jgi:hypothetical protein
MRTVEGQKAKLARILHKLEGGIIVETASDHAIHIPATCLHATLTLSGGYLIAEDFTTPKSIKAISAYIASRLDQHLPAEARSICFDWFERCLDVCLTHQQLDSAIHAWIAAESHLANWLADHRKWRVSVRGLWEQHLHADIHQRCICGNHPKDHIFSTHLTFLLSPSQKHRYVPAS